LVTSHQEISAALLCGLETLIDADRHPFSARRFGDLARSGGQAFPALEGRADLARARGRAAAESLGGDRLTIGGIRTERIIGSAIGWAHGQPGSKLENHDVVH